MRVAGRYPCNVEYRDLDEESQIAEVAKLVPNILAKYGVEAQSVENVNHSYNSTFKVQSATGEYALRINLGSARSTNQVLAEMQWLEALAEEGSLLTPIPIRTLDNELCVSTHFTALDRVTTAVLAKWIPGEEVGEEPNNEQLYEMGRAIAMLQKFAKNFTFQLDAYRPTINRTLMDLEDNLRGEQPSAINDKLYSQIIRGLNLCDSVYEKLSSQEDLLLIHADLHIFNVIQSNGRLGVIDFDDCGIGLPIQDLVITNYYLREDRQREEYVKAGYSSLLELPKISEEDYETLLLGRALLLVGTILDMTAAEDVAAIPGFLKKVEHRLDHYFATGQFALI